jgi:hypothetical protein
MTVFSRGIITLNDMLSYAWLHPQRCSGGAGI